MLRQKDASEDIKTLKKHVESNVVAPLNEAITTLFDHHNYVVLETNRMAEMYQFWNSTKYEQKNPKTQFETTPTIPNVLQYVSNRPHLTESSDDSVTLLTTPCITAGLGSKLAGALQQARKMDAHLTDSSAQSQAAIHVAEFKGALAVTASRADGICELIDRRKQYRKAGQKSRIEAVRASKTDAHQRLQAAKEKLDNFHNDNMRKLSEKLHAPLEVPEVRVQLSSPKE